MRTSLRSRPRPRLSVELRRRVLLVAHPARSGDLLAWARAQRHVLCDRQRFQLFADDATRAAMADELRMPAAALRSFSPRFRRREDSRRAAADLLVLFWDPDEAQPRDPEVRALLATAVRHHVSLACTRRVADFLLLASPRHEELAPLLSWFDERRWAPELALTVARPLVPVSYRDESHLADRRGAVQYCT